MNILNSGHPVETPEVGRTYSTHARGQIGKAGPPTAIFETHSGQHDHGPTCGHVV